MTVFVVPFAGCYSQGSTPAGCRLNFHCSDAQVRLEANRSSKDQASARAVAEISS